MSYVGNPAFFAATGVLLWPFGPKECDVNEECWVGILGCGTPKAEIAGMAHLSNTSLNYQGWSLQSLHTQVVIQGAMGEIIVPDIQVSPINVSEKPEIDVLIGRFVLTTSGNFDIHMRLQEWYPGRLYSPRDASQFSEHTLSSYIQLSPLDYRCPPYVKCSVQWYLQECEKGSLVPNTPWSLRGKNTQRCPDKWVTSAGTS